MTAPLTRTRFAPSPTGFLHLGNVRTALFNYLLARQAGGRFVLRSEDTDQQRSTGEYWRAICEDLRWLGLDWDEGPDVNAAGPYLQSLRSTIYEAHFAQLADAGASYPCYLTAAELERLRHAQLAAGQPPRYDRDAAGLSAAEIERRIAAGHRPAVRFCVPPDRLIEYVDLVRGAQRFHSSDIGDFIIRRADASPSFFFSNAVDDALMGITDVLRGEDHLTNTPRQILLLEALQLRVPRYGHISLLVGADGAPLSKRHGSVSLRELRQRGYLPGAVCNYLARLGHICESNDWLGMEELAAGFRIDRLGRAPARFDATQLDHWQKEGLGHAETRGLRAWLGEVLEQVPGEQRDDFVELVRPNVVFPEDASFWAEVIFGKLSPLSPRDRRVLEDAGPRFFAAALAALATHGADLGAIGGTVSEATGARGRALYMPLRLALTGTAQGPELAGLLRLMPVELARSRLAEWAQQRESGSANDAQDP